MTTQDWSNPFSVLRTGRSLSKSAVQKVWKLEMTFWDEKRTLVTGGAGFIGHRLVAKLLQLGANVTVVGDLSEGTLSNLEAVIDRVEFKNESLLQAAVAKQLLKDLEICFHLAARIGGIGYFHKAPALSLRGTSTMSFNLWDAAVGTDTKMICLSSSMVFERTDLFPTPETDLGRSLPPISGYGFSKLVAEYVAKTYHEQFGVKYVIARPFNAYGPGEMPGGYIGYAHVIPDLIKKTLSCQYPLEMLGSGDQTRSYTYVDDVADAIVHVTERCENDEFNIGTGVETSVLVLAKSIWLLCSRKEPFAVKKLPALEYDVQRRIPDVSKILDLGWRPKVDLPEGLRRTISWTRSIQGRVR